MTSMDLKEKKKILLPISVERMLGYYPEGFLKIDERILKKGIILIRIDTSDLNIKKGKNVTALSQYRRKEKE